MTHEYILWIATAAYGVHMIEETIYDWHGWVRRVLRLNAEWSEFYLVNASSPCWASAARWSDGGCRRRR